VCVGSRDTADDLPLTVTRNWGNRRMGDILLLAGPATRPDELLVCLGRHPEIAAVPAVDIGQRLFRAARARIRSSRANPEGAKPLDLVSLGRTEGAAELSRLFAGVRAESGARIVIFHDPSGPLFPFQDPPPISLLVLVRNAEAAAAAIGAIGIERVIAAARDALAAFQARVGGFGVPIDRIITIQEDRLEADPAAGLAEICQTLGVASDAATVSAMREPPRVDVRRERGP
jgi:hypothetical protein